MPGMSYEEKEIELDAGGSVLFYSDGLVEAHNPKGEMFGFPSAASREVLGNELWCRLRGVGPAEQ